MGIITTNTSFDLFFFLILKKEVGSRIAEGKCRTVLNDQVHL